MRYRLSIGQTLDVVYIYVILFPIVWSRDVTHKSTEQAHQDE